MDCPKISYGLVFDDANSDFTIKKTHTFTVLVLLPVYGQYVIRT